MSKINVTVDRLNSLNPMSIVKDDAIRQRFIDIYGTLWGERDAEAAYEREAIHFNRLLSDSDSLKKCTKASLFIAFIDVAVNGLSLEPGVRALCYLQPRGYKTGQKDSNGRDIYESRCTLTISGYGELVQRTRAGQIRHADNPVIVYEGDEFSFSDHGGRKEIEYRMNINHNVSNPVACYLGITRADGTRDYAILLEEDWRRLQGFSAKANRKWDNNTRQWIERPNDLYQSGEGNRIDSGFLMAKCVKHAFKTYPKLRIGRGSAYEADMPQQNDEPDYYGLEEAGTPSAQPTEAPATRQAETFAPPADTSAGVTVDPAASATSDDDVF